MSLIDQNCISPNQDRDYVIGLFIMALLGVIRSAYSKMNIVFDVDLNFFFSIMLELSFFNIHYEFMTYARVFQI